MSEFKEVDSEFVEVNRRVAELVKEESDDPVMAKFLLTAINATANHRLTEEKKDRIIKRGLETALKDMTD